MRTTRIDSDKREVFRTKKKSRPELQRNISRCESVVVRARQTATWDVEMLVRCIGASAAADVGANADGVRSYVSVRVRA